MFRMSKRCFDESECDSTKDCKDYQFYHLELCPYNTTPFIIKCTNKNKLDCNNCMIKQTHNL
jgi:hypothetical protein